MGEGIGWAVKQLQNGDRVRRAGWNGKGMWLALVSPWRHPGLELAMMAAAGLEPETDFLTPKAAPFVVMRTAQGPLVPWLCSQTDLLAVDWEIATPTVQARATSQATCCHIPDDQQEAVRNGRPFTPCERPAEWEITGAKAPGYPTLACAEHVGQLLGDGLHYVAPFEATGSPPPPVVQTSAREG